MTRQSLTAGAARSPDVVVADFLQALESQDHDRIARLLAPDLRYTNVSLPTLNGGQRVAGLFRMLLRKGTGFAVQTHRLAVNGDTVMTERTDIIKVGPVHVGFWVCGTFQVRDGRIVLWRDYFDWADVARGGVRGLAGVLVPRLRMTLPRNIEV